MASSRDFWRVIESNRGTIELKRAILQERDAAVARSKELRATAAMTIEDSQRAVQRSRALLAELSLLRGAINARRLQKAPVTAA